jgi:hypothetical protein
MRQRAGLGHECRTNKCLADFAGATLAPLDESCPVYSFRGALQTVETGTELSEVFRNHVMELIETPGPQRSLSVDLGDGAIILPTKHLLPFATVCGAQDS